MIAGGPRSLPDSNTGSVPRLPLVSLRDVSIWMPGIAPVAAEPVNYDLRMMYARPPRQTSALASGKATFLLGGASGNGIASRDVAPWIAELVWTAGELDLRSVGRILRHHAVRNEGAYRVVEKGSAHAQGRLSAAGRVVDDAQPGREVRQPSIGEGIGNPGIAGEEETGRRIGIDLAHLARIEGRARKFAAPVVVVEFRQERFPAEAKVDHQAAGGMIGVLHIQPDDVLRRSLSCCPLWLKLFILLVRKSSSGSLLYWPEKLKAPLSL